VIVDPDGKTTPRMPATGLSVDYGAPCAGSSNPMPDHRRQQFQLRIRQVVEAQAAGAEKAAKIFIR
jgi:hypothetical protein